MPFISIIIPTRNNEEHIGKAILSCLENETDDYEIIIINDASSDKTLDQINQATKNIRQSTSVINIMSNIGLGPSRNIGISNAKGRYLMFLDGDDWFEPKALDRVIRNLQDTPVDVLMFNHQRVWDDGRIIPNIPNRYVDLDNYAQDISEPKVRKKIIRNIHSSCNKAYSIEFVKKNNISFPAGFYEDAFWSIVNVVLSNKITYAPDIIFNYRQRAGSITRKIDNRHFDIFKQYKQVMSFLKNNIKYDLLYGDEIYEYAETQILGILNTGYRIAKHQENEYIATANKILADWKSRSYKLVD